MTTSTTSRLGLTTWSADSDVPNWVASFNANNGLVDAQISIVYTDVLANLAKYQGVPGARFFATDTFALFRHNGAAWLPLISRVDTEILSSALPSSAPDGTYYHCTDTDTIWRGTGSGIVQLITSLPASFPVGTLAFLPLTSDFVYQKFYVDLNDGPPALPNGWAYCAGQALSTTTYSALFALIGYQYSYSTWYVSCGGDTQSFLTLPNFAQVKNFFTYFGITHTVDTFNPDLVVSPAWTITYDPVSSGPTFNLPYGVARPLYAYSQSGNQAQEQAYQGLPGPLGWLATNNEPPPASPYLIDGCPSGCFAVIIKTT